MAPVFSSRRLIRALAAAGVLLLSVAGPALAQDEGSSPDENDQVVLTGQLLDRGGPDRGHSRDLQRARRRSRGPSGKTCSS